jgi:hypothetical protein
MCLADSNTAAEDKMSATFKKHGAFFAFSGSQFEEGKVEGVKYMSLGAGLICPVDNAEACAEEIESNGKSRISEDLADNTKKEIIWRELANHEAQITYCTDSTFDALEGYGITREEIQAEFSAYYENCVVNNYF